MPETDAQVRSRERREEVREQQERLNSIRDANSIFTDGQMEGDNAKGWMETHPGDTFLNIVKLLKKHQSILSELSRYRNESTRKINNINDSLIKIDTRSDLFVDELGDFESEQKDMRGEQKNMKNDIHELQNQYRTLTTKVGSAAAKKGSMKKSKRKSTKRKSKKKKSTKRKRYKKRR